RPSSAIEFRHGDPGEEIRAAPLRRAPRRLGLLLSRRRFAPRGSRRAGGGPGASGGGAGGRQRRLCRSSLPYRGEAGGDQGSRRRRDDAGRRAQPLPAASPLRPHRTGSRSQAGRRTARGGHAGPAHSARRQPGRLPQPLPAGYRRRPRPAQRGGAGLLGPPGRACGRPPLPDRRRRRASRPRDLRRRGRSRSQAAGTPGPFLPRPPPCRASTPSPARGGAPQPGPGESRPPPAPPLVATNGVRYARPEDKPLHDVLTAIRHHTTLDEGGRLLASHRERHFKSAAEMSRLFADLPEALANSAKLASELDFTMAGLGYRFPDYPLPPGETPASYLRHVTWNGAKARFRPLTAKAQGQIQKELDLIEKLNLAGYFLIVWDIVNFCLRENILAQGRGSAVSLA